MLLRITSRRCLVMSGLATAMYTPPPLHPHVRTLSTSVTGGSLEHGLQLPAEGGPHAKAPPCKLRLHLPDGTQILVRLRISFCFASNDHGRNMATALGNMELEKLISTCLKPRPGSRSRASFFLE